MVPMCMRTAVKQNQSRVCFVLISRSFFSGNEISPLFHGRRGTEWAKRYFGGERAPNSARGTNDGP